MAQPPYKFSEGQKVRCVCPRDGLKNGGIYIVTRFFMDGGHAFVQIDDQKACPGGVYADRFEPVDALGDADRAAGMVPLPTLPRKTVKEAVGITRYPSSALPARALMRWWR